MRSHWLGAVMLCTACGSGGFSIEERPLSGVVGGAPWSFVAGDTNAFLSDDDFFANLYDREFNTCEFGPAAGSSLILNIPMQVGSYELGQFLTMTFVVEDDDGPLNLISTEGGIRVDEITDTTISGGVDATFDGDNSVNGLFELTICPDDA